MARLRYNGLRTGSAGATAPLTIGGSGLTNSATAVTFNAALTHSNGTAVPTITSPDYIPLTILDSSGNLSEIVWLTAYTSGATTGTITRAQEGTTGVSHASGDKVVHSPSALDVAPGWTTYTPTWTATSGSTNVGSTGSLTGAYQMFGKTVFFRLSLVLGGTGISTGTGTWFFDLPVAHVAAPSGVGQHGVMVAGYFEDLATRAYAPAGARLKASSTTQIELLYGSDALAAGSVNTMGAGSPFTWGSGDFLALYGQYQAA